MDNTLNKVAELAFQDELNKIAAGVNFETAMGQKAVAPARAAAPAQNQVTSKQQVYANVNKAMGANAPRSTNVTSKQQVYANAGKAMGNYAPSNMSNPPPAGGRLPLKAVSGQAAAPIAAPNPYAMATQKFQGGGQFKNMNQAILVRNKAARGSNEWNMAQNAINSAYGRGPQRQAQAMPAGTGARVMAKKDPGSTMTVANFTVGDMLRQNAQTVAQRPQANPVQVASAQ